jgi:cellulose synthase/poly-beta-1,6-N-acetylglucosamine synthase-like glycosyltransferase
VTTLIHGAEALILVYFLALNSFYGLLLLLSIPEVWEQTRLAEDEDLQKLMLSDALPPLTVMVPAYNEGETIETSVTAMLTLEYRQYEVVVVNDGSKDDTLARLREAFELYEVPRIYPETIITRPIRAVYRSRTRTRVTVIDKENGGKADALNAAINASRYPLVIAVDADTLIEPDALLRLTRPFLLGGNVAAVGGTIRVANDCKVEHGRVLDPRVPRHFLAGVQVVEYLRAFLFGRLGWNRLGGNLIISGAFGLFRREYLLVIGGYQTSSVVEDMDVVIRLHRHLREKKIPYVMPFIPDPVAWTEVPVTTTVLGQQRERWHRGLIASLWTYRDMLFNPRYGQVGLVAVPFYFFGEMLAPVVELMGYVVAILAVATGRVDFTFALLFFLFAWGLGLCLSIWGVVLEETSFRKYRRFGDLARLLLFAALENFGYRQCTVWWRLKAFWAAWRKRKTWGEMTRTGFGGPRQSRLYAQSPSGMWQKVE